MAIRSVLAISLAISLLGASAWSAYSRGAPSPSPPDEILGLVVNGDGPVAGAIVRVQGTSLAVATDAQGRFRLTGLTPGEPVALTERVQNVGFELATQFQERLLQCT